MSCDGPLHLLDPADLPPGRSSHRMSLGIADCDLLAVRGERPGPTLLCLGAVHGDEYEGPAALARWWAEIEPDTVHGTLLAVPVVNEEAFYARSRCAPSDGLNLARELPGDPDGSPTLRIAAAIHALLARCDALIDLHAAGAGYTLKPWVGYARLGDQPLEARQRALAFAFGLDFVWAAPVKPGRTLWSAAERGVAAIYVEMTGAGQCRPGDVAQLVRGLRYAASCLGLTDGPYPTEPPRWFRESLDAQEDHLQVQHPAPCRGVWQPAVELWDEVVRGDLLGYVGPPSGLDPQPVTVQRTGRVAMLRTAPPVDQGEFLAAVVPL